MSMQHAARIVAAMLRADKPQSLAEVTESAKVDIATARSFLRAGVDLGVVYSPGVGVIVGQGRRPQLFVLERSTPFEHEHIEAAESRKAMRSSVKKLREQGKTITQIEAALGLPSATVSRALKAEQS